MDGCALDPDINAVTYLKIVQWPYEVKYACSRTRLGNL